jgi:internalin A
MADAVALRCSKCGAHIKVDPSALIVQCPYCGADFIIPGTESDTAWFEKKFGISLTPKQKEGVTWLKRTGRADRCIAGTWLRLADEEITDQDMRFIGTMTFLDELDLNNNGIHDAGIAELTEMALLVTLELGNNSVTPDGLTHIAKLTNLKKLNVEGADIGDEHIEHLMMLTKLAELNIRGTMITEKGILQLSKLPDIQSITKDTEGLFMQPLLKAGVLPLIENVQLILQLNNQDITDEELVHLKGMKKLFSLDLKHNSIHGEGLLHLTGLDISHLNLQHNPIDDSGIQYIQALKKLEFLDIWWTNISKKGVRKLQRGRLGLQIDHSSKY